jgi:hypothetical protein
MGTIRWVLLIMSGLLWLLTALANYGALIASLRTKFVSGVPLPLGTLSGVAFLALVPASSCPSRWWFLPLALAADVQVWWSLGYFAIKGLCRAIRGLLKRQ